MTTATIRKRLQEYISYADDKKIKAIYTMVEDEIAARQNWWEDKGFLQELDSRVKDFEQSGFKGRTWEEIKEETKNL